MEMRGGLARRPWLAGLCSSVLVIILVFASVLCLAADQPAYPSARFAVISDLHIFDTSLGAEGPLFEQYISSDRKLLIESIEILEAAVERLKKEDLDFVIVSGDLTKDGEKLNHERCASILSTLIDEGTKVYVVPGNHDILNSHAVMFQHDGAQPVPTATPEEFEEIYRELGYGEAIRRDSASLSYVVEPLPGLWIVAMDACRYRDNKAGKPPVVDGRFPEETLRWLDQVLNEAVSSGKAVLGVMHHGVLEHYKGQEKFYGDYLVDDWPMIAERLAAGGVRVVFTGHYHSQDIVKRAFNTRIGGERRTVFIFDVETGSMVTYPCAYRIIEITEDQTMRIRSRFIDAIPSRPEGFHEYARDYVHSGIAGIAERTLTGYWVSEESAQILAPQVANAILAHYRGDERPPEVLLDTNGVSLWGKIIVLTQGGLVNGLWNDLEPPDNDIDVDLTTGEWRVP